MKNGTVKTPKIMAYNKMLIWKFMACLPWVSINSDFSLLTLHKISGPIKFPKGTMNLEKVDKWMNVAMFLW